MKPVAYGLGVVLLSLLASACDPDGAKRAAETAIISTQKALKSDRQLAEEARQTEQRRAEEEKYEANRRRLIELSEKIYNNCSVECKKLFDPATMSIGSGKQAVNVPPELHYPNGWPIEYTDAGWKLNLSVRDYKGAAYVTCYTDKAGSVVRVAETLP